MPDKPFVINDRRKFTTEGELRPGVELNTAPAATETLPPETEPGRSTDEPAGDTGNPGKQNKEPLAFPSSSPKSPSPEPDRSEDEPDLDDDEPQTAARTHETIAFPSGNRADADEPSQEETADILPPLTREQLEQAARAYDATVERLDTAMRANNLGGEPLPAMSFERLIQSLYMQSLMQLGGAAEPGQPPQVDLLGARQTIDMLAIIAAKSEGNLSPAESQFIDSALFELRMGFLEVTQALARQAASRQPAGAGAPKGPGIVR